MSIISYFSQELIESMDLEEKKINQTHTQIVVIVGLIS